MAWRFPAARSPADAILRPAIRLAALRQCGYGCLGTELRDPAARQFSKCASQSAELSRLGEFRLAASWRAGKSRSRELVFVRRRKKFVAPRARRAAPASRASVPPRARWRLPALV